MYEVDVASNPTELRQKLNDLASPWYLHSVVPLVGHGNEGKLLIIARLGKHETPQSTMQEAHPEDFKRW